MNTIEQLDVFTFKYPHHYKIGGHEDTPNRLPGTDYYIEPQWKQAYSKATESCLVKITTADGVVGWGEAQSPITPETTSTLIRTLLGPALLGQDAERIDHLNERLFGLMLARGHVGSFIVDAIAGIDTALWDIRGKVAGKAIGALLTDAPSSTLSAYISGLRKKTLEEKVHVARQFVRDGFAGVKLFVGADVELADTEARAVRSALPNSFFAVDALWSLNEESAAALARTLDELNADWLESPLDPQEIEAHVTLVKSARTSIAVGEVLRTAKAFQPWLQAGALSIAQPDVMRTGITGALAIQKLAQNSGVQTALHVGVCTGIGMAATWQVASAIAHDLPQEHQGDLFETANVILTTPLAVADGKLQVPSSPGIGVKVDESVVERFSTEHWIVDSKGHRLAGGSL